MKAKNIIIASLTAVSVTAVSVYAAYRYASKNRAVNVVQVAGVNESTVADDSYGEMSSGEIIANNMQKVTLNNDYTVLKVYVSDGDSVKKGDTLLTYDMSMLQLQRDSEDLSNQILVLQMQQLQNSIDKMLKTYGRAQAIYNKILQDEKNVREEMETISLEPESYLADFSDDSSDTDSSNITARLDDSETDIKTGSADTISPDEDSAIIDDNADNTFVDDNSVPENENSETQDPGVIQESTIPQTEPIQEDNSGQGLIAEETTSVDDVLIDPENNQVTPVENQSGETIIIDNPSEESETLPSDDSLVTDESEHVQTDTNDAFQTEAENMSELESEGTDLVEYDPDVIGEIKDFLSLESLVRSAYTTSGESMDYEDIERAVALFQNNMSEVPSAENNTLYSIMDAAGETSQISIYLINPYVLDTLQAFENASDKDVSANEMIVSLYRAYANILYFNLVYQMNTLSQAMTQDQINIDTITNEQALALKDQIRAALDAYYSFTANWENIKILLQETYGVSTDVITVIDEGYKQVTAVYAGNNYDINDSTDGTLSKLAYALKQAQLIEETETSATESEETDFIPDDDGGGDGGGDIDSMSDEEIESALRSNRSEYLETELKKRESDNKLKEYDEKLKGGTVEAILDGTVTMGDADNSSDSGSDVYMTVVGENELFVRGTVNESKLDDISTGDLITGTDENGNSFSAEIVEISQYPSSSGGDMYGMYSSGNANTSDYPFLAAIDNSENVMEGYADITFASKEEPGSNIYLDTYFIRYDTSGRPYVYITDEEGKLKQQNIKTGESLYGYYIEVLSGITEDDYIAFPYGRDVKPGASTTVVDSLMEN